MKGGLVAAGAGSARDPRGIPLLLRVSRLRSGNRDERLQLQEALLPHSPHVHQVFELIEGTTLLA